METNFPDELFVAVDDLGEPDETFFNAARTPGEHATPEKRILGVYKLDHSIAVETVVRVELV